MKAYYYLNGEWKEYLTGRDFIVTPDKINAAFKFNSLTTGKETTANGKNVPFSELRIAKQLPGINIQYYKRIGSTGPSLFALDFTDTKNAVVTDLPKNSNNTMFWLILLTGLGYLTLG